MNPFFSFTLYLLQELLQIMSAKLGKEYDLLNLALHEFYSKYDIITYYVIRYFMNTLHDIKNSFFIVHYIPFLF